MQEATWMAAPGAAADNNLFVRFHMGAVLDPVASQLAGRPKFKDCPFVMIAVPGDKSVVIDRPVWDDENEPNSDTQRFPKAWAAFKNGVGDDIQSGTPLSEWAAVTRGQVEELAHFKVRTVEQLANLSDQNAQKFMGSLALRQKAQDWLRASEKTRPFDELRAEMAKKDEAVEALRAELVSLQAKVAEASKAQPSQEPKRKVA